MSTFVSLHKKLCWAVWDQNWNKMKLLSSLLLKKKKKRKKNVDQGLNILPPSLESLKAREAITYSRAEHWFVGCLELATLIGGMHGWRRSWRLSSCDALYPSLLLLRTHCFLSTNFKSYRRLPISNLCPCVSTFVYGRPMIIAFRCLARRCLFAE